MNFLKAKLPKMNALAIATILAILGGLGYAGARVRSWVTFNAHLRLELSRVYKHAFDQRNALVTEISSYKQALGFYPPDHLVCKDPVVVDPVTNQLYYELCGTVFDPASHNSSPLKSSTSLPATLIHNFFNVDRFKNSAETADAVKHFLTGREPLIELHEKPETIGLLSFFPNWEGLNWDAVGEMRFSSWRYNSSKPIHNPGGFDLWIEIEAPGTNIVIGNW